MTDEDTPWKLGEKQFFLRKWFSNSKLDTKKLSNLVKHAATSAQ
jgi:hypothetical protein